MTPRPCLSRDRRIRCIPTGTDHEDAGMRQPGALCDELRNDAPAAAAVTGRLTDVRELMR